jgi:intracellular septation protein
VLYWLMGAGLLFGQLLFKKNGIKSLMGGQMKLPDAIWHKVNLAWVGFFTSMGFLNLWVAYNFSTSTWVNFKLFGGMGLMFAFIVAQALFLNKYIESDATT